MKILSEFAWKIVEIGLGAAVTLVAWRYSNTNNIVELLTSVGIGLLTTTSVAMIVEPLRLRESFSQTQEQNEELLKTISNVASTNTEHLCLLLKYGTDQYDKNQMPRVWLELMWRMRKGGTFRATSYTCPESWSEQHAEYGRDIQKMKIAADDATVERVFIVENDQELQRLDATMQQHVAAGIKVKYIQRSKIDRKGLRKRTNGCIETLDFGLFDGMCVFLWDVDSGTRELLSGRLDFRPTVYKCYEDFFYDLHQHGTELRSNGQVPPARAVHA